MTVKLLTGNHLEFISLKRVCTGSYESTLVKIPHCWKPHVTAHRFLAPQDMSLIEKSNQVFLLVGATNSQISACTCISVWPPICCNPIFQDLPIWIGNSGVLMLTDRNGPHEMSSVEYNVCKCCFLQRLIFLDTFRTTGLTDNV